MRRLTIVALGTVALSGCTGSHIAKPAVCDGKHRRPANLYGTILPTLPVPLPASQGGGRSMIAPGPPPGPGALPAPPQAPSPSPAPAPTPAPDAAGVPSAGAKDAAPARRASRRDDAASYLSC